MCQYKASQYEQPVNNEDAKSEQKMNSSQVSKGSKKSPIKYSARFVKESI